MRYPFVVVTAAQNARAWAQEIGADAYLAEPFRLRDLLRVVERFCGRAGTAGEDPSGGASFAYQ